MIFDNLYERTGYKPTIGVELEILLTDEEGFVANKADAVISDPNSEGAFYKEARLCQVEINSTPTTSVAGQHKDLVERLMLLERIGQEHHIIPVSSSEFGAKKGINRERSPRYRAYDNALGNISLQLSQINGIHLHFARFPGKEVEQYSLLLALDSLSYALTSTSPITENCQNGLNNHRINLVRNVIYHNFPLLAQLQNYPKSMEEFDNSDQERLMQWFNASGLEPEIFFSCYDKGNTGYHPIRWKREERFGPTGTWEVRSFDSAPLHFALPAIALYKGCNDYAMTQNIPISISEHDGEYIFSEDRIVLPNHTTLLKLQDETIQYGLKSNMVIEYAKEVATFSRKGIETSPEDAHYMDRLDEIIASRSNPASLIMNHMRSLGYQGHQFEPIQSAQAILFARKLHLEGLNYKPQLN